MRSETVTLHLRLRITCPFTYGKFDANDSILCITLLLLQCCIRTVSNKIVSWSMVLWTRYRRCLNLSIAWIGRSCDFRLFNLCPQITAHVVPHYVIFNLFRPEVLDRTVAVISPSVLWDSPWWHDQETFTMFILTSQSSVTRIEWSGTRYQVNPPQTSIVIGRDKRGTSPHCFPVTSAFH